MKSIKRFFKKYHEFVTLSVIIGVWLLSAGLLREMDPTAAVFDAGIFQIPIFAIFQFILFISLAWIMLGIAFTTFQNYLQTDMKNDFKNLTPWERIRLAYFVYFGLLFSLILLAKTLIAGRP